MCVMCVVCIKCVMCVMCIKCVRSTRVRKQKETDSEELQQPSQVIAEHEVREELDDEDNVVRRIAEDGTTIGADEKFRYANTGRGHHTNPPQSPVLSKGDS